ncbi:peptide ABC transporter permease [Sphaerisporangium krabiense]|uniref:Peptide/nickel transport system permease protein n=1 Tax=Sphaerisporangium krabiense TaxID=763782 RepID=A0A7W9DR77_9ACTN|nr:ABC transporter permease [Sphaerisporangium krabiense]MBB5628357.1 peptide/nickel transport system permease protein [Sphaerisporangium krabiense]GII66903.1 peptide ABC transporter permease [Sphaerisporangium krabiense]
MKLSATRDGTRDDPAEPQAAPVAKKGHPVRRRLAGHLVRGLVMIWVVTTISFVIIRNIPGDPVRGQYEALIERGMSPEQAERATAVLYGFLPTGTLWEQYVGYMKALLHLDLGQSLSTPGTEVTTLLGSAASWTILPVLGGTLLSFLLGVTLGVYAGIKRAGKLGDLLTISGSLLHGVPQYVLGLLMLAIFTTLWPILPAGGPVDVEFPPGLNGPYLASLVQHATLPVLTYALASYGGWVLAMKSSVATVLGDDFILAAELRGLSRWVLFRYVARNAILPLFTILALSLGMLFGGAIFIERIFNYPGLGLLLVDSIGARDYALMGGAFLVTTIAVVIANIAADLLYTVIDPRVRTGGAA